MFYSTVLFQSLKGSTVDAGYVSLLDGKKKSWCSGWDSAVQHHQCERGDKSWCSGWDSAVQHHQCERAGQQESPRSLSLLL